MKRKTLLLALLAVVIVAMASIGPAMSYFTTYAETRGTRPLHMGEETVEWLSQWRKHVTVTNEGNSQVFVRARAVGPAEFPLTYEAGEGWYDGGDGWWYYVRALNAYDPDLAASDPENYSGLGVKDSTSTLDVVINNVPNEMDDPSLFNVVVFTQSVYAKDGMTNDPATWANIDSGEEEPLDDEQWGGTNNG